MDRSWNEIAYSASGASRIAFRLLAVYRWEMSAVVSVIAATMPPSRAASRHIRCRKYRSLSRSGREWPTAGARGAEAFRAQKFGDGRGIVRAIAEQTAHGGLLS